MNSRFGFKSDKKKFRGVLIRRGHAMTHAQVYQHGMKAFIDGIPLTGNPFDSALSPKTHQGWADGWLDARQARWRFHAHEILARLSMYPAFASASNATSLGR
jgi:hypothetical protein